MEHARTHSGSRRPQPVRSKPGGRTRRRRVFGLWPRLVLLAAVVLVFIVGTIGLVAKGLRPYREARTISGQLAVSQQQAAALDSENNALQRQISYLQTAPGRVHEAREMGYIRPGEVPIVVENPAGDTPAAAPAAAAVHPGPLMSARLRMGRLWRHVTGR